MARLLILIAQYLLSSFVTRLLLGAGLSLGSFYFIDGLFEKYISLAQESSDGFKHGLWGLMALSGLTKFISLCLSAATARVVIQTSQLSLKKL